MKNAGIIGMGHAYPEGILTNADLEKIVDTTDEWITSRTGIKQRHKAADNEYTSQFGTKAAQQALERAGLKAEDIDIIVCATTTPDQIMPSTGALDSSPDRRDKCRRNGYFCGLFGISLRLDDGRINDSDRTNSLCVGDRRGSFDEIR